MFIVGLVFLSYIYCEKEYIAIHCKDKIVKQFTEKSNWKKVNYSILCPINGDDVIKICNNAYNNPNFNYVKYVDSKLGNVSLNENYKVYQCLVIDKSQTLDVPADCVFQHTLNEKNICLSEQEWKIKAENICSKYDAQELARFNGIFQCEISNEKPEITYKSIQYVCCPKLNAYDTYKIHFKGVNGTIKSEKQAFQLAKQTLREKFKSRQKEIQDRFVLEEKSIDIWSKYPNIASSLENKIQNKFQEKFMSEMYKEVDLLKELEIIHENRMQKLFEDNRKSAKARLEYTLQETNPQAGRIAGALQLELQSIIAEANDTIEFYETLLLEDLSNKERNKELIRGNFNSLIVHSWDEVIGLLDKVPTLKDEILIKIKEFILQKETLIKRFKYLDNDYIPKNSMKYQAENHVKNMISIYGHGSTGMKSDNDIDEKKISMASRFIMVFLFCLSIMLLMALSILLYRFHGKINSYLSNTFKKIHPPTKSLLVQIENYPFKNRYNYGNGIFQPFFKSEESIIGHPHSVYNQHFSSVTEASNEGSKKSVESDYNESSISNINGLENPICRLLDEK